MTENLDKKQSEIKELVSFQLFYSGRKIKATWCLAVIIAIMFLLEELFGGSTNTAVLVKMGADVTELVRGGEYWRLMTCVFLHAGFMHVFLNTYVLFALGGFFNKILGDSIYLTVFLFSGITGSLASAFIAKPQVSVGASGAIWGLFGASLAISFIKNPLIPEVVRLSMRRVTLINLAINLGVSFLPMVDIWAHIGGGVGGFLISLLIIADPKSAQAQVIKKWFFNITAFFLVLIYVVSFVFAISQSRPWVNQFNAELSLVNLPAMPFVVGVPQGLSMTPGAANNAQKASFSFGDLKYDSLAIELNIISEQVIGEKLDNKWLEIQRTKLLNDAQLEASVKKTLDLRKEELRNILFFQQDFKNKLVVYNYLFVDHNYLVKLILVMRSEEKQVVAENLAKKIIASFKKI